MENFIHQNGYVTVFLTVAFSGEFGLFAGIALARAGSVTLPGVIAVGTIASFVGNMFSSYLIKSFTGFRELLLWGLLTSAIVAGLYLLIRKAVSRFQG